MGLWDIVRKGIGAGVKFVAPGLSPFVDKTNSFLDGLGLDEVEGTATRGLFGSLMPAGKTPFETPGPGQIPLQRSGDALGVKAYRPSGPFLPAYNTYARRQGNIAYLAIAQAANRSKGDVVATRTKGAVTPKRGGTAARPASSRTLKA